MTQNGDSREYSVEEASRHIARTLMYVTVKKSVMAIDSFLTWLLAGTGATFGLVIANLDGLSSYLDQSHVKLGAFLFLSGALLAVVEKYMASILIAVAEGAAAAQEQSHETFKTFPNLDLKVLQSEFDSVTLPVTRFFKWCFNKVFPVSHPAHNAAKGAQIASQIGLLSILLILSSVAVLAIGLQL